MRAKTDIRNWLWFLNLRMRPGAQWEIRQYANVVGDILKTLFPRTWDLFEEYDLYGAPMSRTELKVLRQLLMELDADHRGRLIKSYSVKAGLSGSKLSEFVEKLEKGGLEILG
jgi:thymidylate synthase ThyX